MALNFFKQRDIDEMDVNDIPEEFINYLETLDEAGKIGLLASRPDIAKVLGVSVEDSNQDTVNTTDDSSEIVQEDERNPKSSAVFEEEQDIRNSVDVEADVDEPEEVNEEFIAIQNNYYEGKRLAEILKDNMEPLEALAIPDKTDKCFIHRAPFKEKQIRYTGKGATYGVVLKICPQCNRIYLEESGKEYIHEALTKRNIAHTFYSLETSNQYLRSQIKAYEIADQDKIYIPEIWTEDNPLCPVHEEALFEIPCIKKYKDRKVEFTGYFCDKCNKILMRSSSVAELEDNCALNGVPVIETESFVKKRPKKQLIKMREIKPDYIVENGKREIYTYSHAADCFKLTEEDTVVVSDSIYCSLEGHKTEEVLVLIWVNQKKGGRKSYIFVVGYCSQCQKYYMDIDDYNVIYSLGRPEVTIIIILADNKIFATQRGYGEFKDGWEFPGGKIEPDETPEHAIIREIKEELDTEIEVIQLLDTVEYDYPKFHLSMDCFICNVKSGDLILKEHEAAKWLTKETLYSVDWLPADQALIGKIEKYLEEHA